MRSWGWSPYSGISALTRGRDDCSNPWGHGEKAARKRVPLDAKYTSNLVLNFLASRTVRNKCLLFKLKKKIIHTVASKDQIISVAQLCPTLFDPMNWSMPGLPVHHQLPEFTQTHVHPVMPSSHLILCCPLLLLCPIPPSIRVFSNESTLRMRWPKYWSFSFSIIPSKEIPGLISFRMDWLDLLAVQGTLKSLLQHHSSKASILQCSAFFTVQLSHPYMTGFSIQEKP